MAEMIPAPEAVTIPAVSSTVIEETNTSAEQTTPEVKTFGTEKEPNTATEQLKEAQAQDKEKELTPAELARKERNKQRWQQMKQERQDALQRAAWAEAELAKVRNTKIDYSQIQDPDEALALRTAQRVREMGAEDQEARVAMERQRAEQAMYDAWSSIKEDAKDRMPDFDQVVTDNTPIHRFAAPFLVESEKGGEIAYYLGKNPDVARDLYRKFDIAPAQALIDLGRIEARVSSSVPKQTTKAPKPAPTLQGMASPPGFDQATASVSDIAAELKRVGVIR